MKGGHIQRIQAADFQEPFLYENNRQHKIRNQNIF
jgi:hypothetical protein